MKRCLFVCLMAISWAALAAAPAVGAERVAVTGEIANIRSGPGASNDQLWQVERYHPLVIVEKKEPWYRIRDFEGDEGWIHDSLVGKLDAVIIKANRCNIRSGPGTQYDVLFSVDKGIPFKVLQRKGKWIELEHADGDRGWILNTLVW